jgi:transcriptional regulator with XRE-family HTH domain
MTDEELARLVAENVRAARSAAALTQGQLSERSGIEVPHLSRLESGAHLPSLKTLNRVADALGVPLARLVSPPRGKKAQPPSDAPPP